MDTAGIGHAQTAPRADVMPGLGASQAMVLSALATVASRLRGRSSFLTLIFHRVLPEWDPLLPDEPSRASFAAQLDLVSRLFNVLPLSEAVARAASRSLPARAACITFDDGYANNLEVAAPLLAERRLPATVFVATGFLGGRNMWNDTLIESIRRAPRQFDLADLGLPRFELDGIAARRAAIGSLLDALKYLSPVERAARVAAIADRIDAAGASRLMLTEDGVRQLEKWGIEVGAHTLHHPILTQLGDEESWDEIIGSKRTIEDILGHRITGFAYPNGRPARDYERRHVEMVRKAGFHYAVSTAWGCAGARSDPLQLPRLAAWDRTPLRYAARLIRAYTQRTSVTV
jgi:peptidoglycan/xylan/chitin deacetylase (PgdA/CDA1 family)